MPERIEMQSIISEEATVTQKSLFVGICNYRANFLCYFPNILVEFAKSFCPEIGCLSLPVGAFEDSK